MVAQIGTVGPEPSLANCRIEDVDVAIRSITSPLSYPIDRHSTQVTLDGKNFLEHQRRDNGSPLS